MKELAYYISRQIRQIELIKDLEKRGLKTRAAYKQLMRYMKKVETLARG